MEVSKTLEIRTPAAGRGQSNTMNISYHHRPSRENFSRQCFFPLPPKMTKTTLTQGQYQNISFYFQAPGLYCGPRQSPLLGVHRITHIFAAMTPLQLGSLLPAAIKANSHQLHLLAYALMVDDISCKWPTTLIHLELSYIANLKIKGWIRVNFQRENKITLKVSNERNHQLQIWGCLEDKYLGTQVQSIKSHYCIQYLKAPTKTKNTLPENIRK